MEHVITIPCIEGNATPVVTDILRNLPADKPVVIRFEKGVYTFDKDGCFPREITGGYLSKSVKQIIFLLENCNDVTIDGGGSTFMFVDRLFPFALFNCRNITLENFKIDFNFCRYCQGKVIRSDEDGFELEIDRKAFSFSINEAGNVTFASGSDRFSTADLAILIGNTVFGKPPWDYIFTGDDSLDKSHLATTYIETDAEETASGLRFTYRAGSRRLKLDVEDILFFNYEPRANLNIMVGECENITIRNVEMYRSGGMGVACDFSKDILIDGLQVRVPEDRQDFFSLTADSMFFTHCYGNVIVRNSLVEKTIDDALNIHGFYTIVDSVNGKQMVLKEGLASHCGTRPGYPGNRMQFYDQTTQELSGEAVIESVTALPDGSFEVIADRELDFISPGDLVENDTLSANFLFENNRLFRCPQLRVSDNGKLIIRNNVFEECVALLVDDLIDYWRETGCVNDLLIEGNTFINTPRAGGNEGAVRILTTRIPSCSVRNKNIRISGNVFQNTERTPVQIEMEFADDIVISDNTFACGDLQKLITARECSNLTQNNNIVKQ